jgi:hypothetical protein
MLSGMALTKGKIDEAGNAILDEITRRAPQCDLLGLGVLADAYAAVVHGAKSAMTDTVVGGRTARRAAPRRRTG